MLMTETSLFEIIHVPQRTLKVILDNAEKHVREEETIQ